MLQCSIFVLFGKSESTANDLKLPFSAEIGFPRPGFSWGLLMGSGGRGTAKTLDGSHMIVGKWRRRQAKKRAPLLDAQRGILYSDKKAPMCTDPRRFSVTQVTVRCRAPIASGMGAHRGRYSVGLLIADRLACSSRRGRGRVW